MASVAFIPSKSPSWFFFEQYLLADQLFDQLFTFHTAVV
jgi:hypothetical protein